MRSVVTCTFALRALMIIMPIAVSACARSTDTAALRFARLFALHDEVVFAYARISGDGRYLVYSSAPDDVAGTGPGGTDRRILRVRDVVANQVVYQAPGFDGYWSPDGTRLIFKAKLDRRYSATVWNRTTGVTTADVMPNELGDYYSWGHGPAGDVILTISGWFVDLDHDRAAGVPRQMPVCPEIGRGLRPLISRNGVKATVFVKDQIVLRNVRECQGLVYTGMTGAKADWSPDGRYIAFHTPKMNGGGYEIAIFDSVSLVIRRLSGLAGSSYFPSWTDDNALVFRYDGPDFNGFMRADGGLSSPPAEMPHRAVTTPDTIREQWAALLPARPCVVVLVWGALGAHTTEALAQFVSAEAKTRCTLITAYDPAGDRRRVRHVLEAFRLPAHAAEAPWDGMRDTGAFNQDPSYLLFEDGYFVRRALGTMSSTAVLNWLDTDARPAAIDVSAATAAFKSPRLQGVQSARRRYSTVTFAPP